MPDYDYLCPDCGPFVATRRMAEFDQPQPCPHCGEPAPRAMSAPNVATRSAAAPMIGPCGRPATGCGCMGDGGMPLCAAAG